MQDLLTSSHWGCPLHSRLNLKNNCSPQGFYQHAHAISKIYSAGRQGLLYRVQGLTVGTLRGHMWGCTQTPAAQVSVQAPATVASPTGAGDGRLAGRDFKLMQHAHSRQHPATQANVSTCHLLLVPAASPSFSLASSKAHPDPTWDGVVPEHAYMHAKCPGGLCSPCNRSTAPRRAQWRAWSRSQCASRPPPSPSWCSSSGRSCGL